MSDSIKTEPVVMRAPTAAGVRHEEVRLPLTQAELARERLRAKVDILTETASVKGQLQKEPLKIIGGASAAGALVGLVLGSQMRRSKKIYVDANSPLKYQKALVKAQQKENGGGALVATLVTLGARALGNPLVQDRLQALAKDLLDKAQQADGAQIVSVPEGLPSSKARPVASLGAPEMTNPGPQPRPLEIEEKQSLAESRVQREAPLPSNPAARRFERGTTVSASEASNPNGR